MHLLSFFLLNSYKIGCLLLFLLIVFRGLSLEANDRIEISPSEAINIAIDVAKKQNFNVNNRDIEVLKVKGKIERGPIRLVWLIRYFPREERNILFNNEYWIVYFYPKGGLEQPHILGGEFCALVELHSGDVLAAFKVP